MTSTNELREQLLVAQGRAAVLEILVWELFSVCPDKRHVLRQFLAGTETAPIRALYSSFPEEFYQSVQQARIAYEATMRDGLQLELSREALPPTVDPLSPR
jgi:hypothetical protein